MDSTIDDGAADSESEARNPNDCELCHSTSSGDYRLQSMSVNLKFVARMQDSCRLLDPWLPMDLSWILRCESSEDLLLETVFYRVQGFLQTQGFDVWKSFAERRHAKEKVMEPRERRRQPEVSFFQACCLSNALGPLSPPL